MQRSTKLHLVALTIAFVGFCMLAIPLWIVRDARYPGALALGGVALVFLGVWSGLGFGPLGRARNRAAAAEDFARRVILEPKQPWQQ